MVKEFKLQPDQYVHSTRLREWARKNKNSKYIPEPLLEAWGFEIESDPDRADCPAGQRRAEGWLRLTTLERCAGTVFFLASHCNRSPEQLALGSAGRQQKRPPNRRPFTKCGVNYLHIPVHPALKMFATSIGISERFHICSSSI